MKKVQILWFFLMVMPSVLCLAQETATTKDDLTFEDFLSLRADLPTFRRADSITASLVLPDLVHNPKYKQRIGYTVLDGPILLSGDLQKKLIDTLASMRDASWTSGMGGYVEPCGVFTFARGDARLDIFVDPMCSTTNIIWQGRCVGMRDEREGDDQWSELMRLLGRVFPSSPRLQRFLGTLVVKELFDYELPGRETSSSTQMRKLLEEATFPMVECQEYPLDLTAEYYTRLVRKVAGPDSGLTVSAEITRKRADCPFLEIEKHIGLIVSPPGHVAAPVVTIFGENIKWSDVLRFTCAQTGTRFYIDGNVLTITDRKRERSASGD